MAVPTKQSVTIAYGRLESQVAPLFWQDKGIIDNAFGANPTWKWMAKNAMRKPLAGGERIYFPVRLTKRGGEGSYSDLDNISIVRPDNKTVGQVQTKEYARNVTISRRDEDLIRGDRAVAEVLVTEMEDALTTLIDDLNADMFGDGTANSSKVVGGLPLWVATDPTAAGTTPAGINQNANSNWRNQTQDNNDTAANVLSDLRTLLTTSKSGNRGPKYGVCNRTFRNVLLADFTDTYQHNPVITPGAVQPLTGKAGDPAIGTLYYQGIPITEDEDAALSGGGNCYCWFLDPSTFVIVDALRAGNRRADLIEWVPLHELDQQTAKVGFMRSHLALFCVERRRNGIFFDGPAS